ncbi:MAG: hypothetical protein HFJ28_01450 [Clostridia bacterium]|jgi:hypothetical protein|nr:hypothetical protein [Clostridia bacterium]
MKNKVSKILFIASFMTIISLTLNVILVVKLIKENVPLYGAYYVNKEGKVTNIEIQEHNAGFENFFSGECNSKIAAEKLNYIYDINILHRENKDKIVYVKFEGREYEIMKIEELEDLQKQVGEYKGNYYFNIQYNQNTGFCTLVTLNKI